MADGIATCYNSILAGVICQVADEIATVGWMCMLDGIPQAHMILWTITSYYKYFKNQYGIDGRAMDWYDSYLHPRSYIVDVKGSKSTLQPLECLVTQGSCGGLVLYSVYASTLKNGCTPTLRS